MEEIFSLVADQKNCQCKIFSGSAPYMGTGLKLGGGSPLGRFRPSRNALIFFRGGSPALAVLGGGSPKLGRFSLVFYPLPSKIHSDAFCGEVNPKFLLNTAYFVLNRAVRQTAQHVYLSSLA